MLEKKIAGDVMEWIDLKRLDTLIQQTEALGACVEEIGQSLYGVTVGDKHATRTVVIVAGLHAAEVIAPLTAMSILQTLVHNPVSIELVNLKRLVLDLYISHREKQV